MTRADALQLMELLYANRAPDLPPNALGEVVDQLYWCLDDGGGEIPKIREEWLASNDRYRVELALSSSFAE